MNILSLFLLAAALAMDAFAVAVCIGLTAPKFRLKNAIIVGLYFGLFQAAMPLIGYVVGDVLAERITYFDHWVVFALLTLLGVKMIMGSFKKGEGCTGDSSCTGDCCTAKEVSLGFMGMFPLAFATSIDALAAGVSFAFARVNIVLAIVLIGVVTFMLSAVGVKIGGVAGVKFKSKAELAGGIVLILLAIRALVEGIISGGI